MSNIFPVFHISQLKKCLRVLEERIEVKNLKIGSNLVYQEQPIKFLDTKDRVIRNNTVKTYKVLWCHHDEWDTTWETDAYLRDVYPKFLQKMVSNPKSRGEILLRWRVVTPLLLSMLIHYICIMKASSSASSIIDNMNSMHWWLIFWYEWWMCFEILRNICSIILYH
jgi:hypothetical protein